MKYIIDRIEGNIAVCECQDGSFVNIPISEIYGRIRDGAVIEKTEERFSVNEEKTRERSERVKSKFLSLIKNDNNR